MVTAIVPGNVELDLMQAGKLPDLSVGNNIYRTRELEGYQWWYQRKFPTPKRPRARVELVFEGLDCLGTIFLNGQMIGETHNMFIAHRFEVTALLRAEGVENELVVRLDSAVIGGRQHQPAAIEGAFLANWESLAIRKAPHMYGWDITAPHRVGRPMAERALGNAAGTRWTDVYFATLQANPAQKKARVMVDWNSPPTNLILITGRCACRWSMAEKPSTPPRMPVVNPHDRNKFDLDNVELWWPRGYGGQPLYDLTLELWMAPAKFWIRGGSRWGFVPSSWCVQTSPRPEKPGEFVFMVNGEKIFVKGSNWVPLDSLHSRDQQHLPGTFAMVVDLNCNMLRCWGGNVYEDHDFFELCDRIGVMVWQDFAMACAIYPQTDAFAAEIRQEAEAVVDGSCATIPAWPCGPGNNEIDQAYSGWFAARLDPNTDRLSRQVLPEVVRQFDPCAIICPVRPITARH